MRKKKRKTAKMMPDYGSKRTYNVGKNGKTLVISFYVGKNIVFVIMEYCLSSIITFFNKYLSLKLFLTRNTLKRYSNIDQK